MRANRIIWRHSAGREYRGRELQKREGTNKTTYKQRKKGKKEERKSDFLEKLEQVIFFEGGGARNFS